MGLDRLLVHRHAQQFSVSIAFQQLGLFKNTLRMGKKYFNTTQ